MLRVFGKREGSGMRWRDNHAPQTGGEPDEKGMFLMAFSLLGSNSELKLGPDTT